MMRSRDQIKAELLAEVEEMIDELLARSESEPAPTLAELEDRILELRRGLEERVEEVLGRDREAASRPGPVCSGCGEEMRLAGAKEVTMVSSGGELELEREYYTCPRCGRSVFLPGSARRGKAEG